MDHSPRFLFRARNEAPLCVVLQLVQELAKVYVGQKKFTEALRVADQLQSELQLTTFSSEASERLGEVGELVKR